MRGRGVSTRVRSPRAAPGVTAPVHWPPRKAWRASTTGEKRQVGPGAGRASSRRPTRAGGAVTGWTSACTTMGGAGVGPTTARSQRRGAGRPVARPLERRACRRTQALRRHVAAGRSRRVSSRARRRSRLASASRAGPSTGGRSPERLSRASGRASRRSVVPRSPGFVGSKEGATTQQPSPGCSRERESQEPQGPASETPTRCFRCACSCRRSVSLAHCRVPIGPRERPAAPWSWATEATASDSWWTSHPTESVRDGCRADLRVWCIPADDRMRFWFRYATPRSTQGQPTHRKSLCLDSSEPRDSATQLWSIRNV